MVNGKRILLLSAALVLLVWILHDADRLAGLRATDEALARAEGAVSREEATEALEALAVIEATGEEQDERRVMLFRRAAQVAVARHGLIRRVGIHGEDARGPYHLPTLNPSVTLRVEPPALRPFVAAIRIGEAEAALDELGEAVLAVAAEGGGDEVRLPVELWLSIPRASPCRVQVDELHLVRDMRKPSALVIYEGRETSVVSEDGAARRIATRPGLIPDLRVSDALGLSSARWTVNGTEAGTSFPDEQPRVWSVPLSHAPFANSGQDVHVVLVAENVLGTRCRYEILFAVRAAGFDPIGEVLANDASLGTGVNLVAGGTVRITIRLKVGEAAPDLILRVDGKEHRPDAAGDGVLVASVPVEAERPTGLTIMIAGRAVRSYQLQQRP